MRMSKRGYLLAALVAALSVAAWKMWADNSWSSQGHPQPDTPAVAAEAHAKAEQSPTRTNPQAVTVERFPEAEDRTDTDTPAFISGPFYRAKGNPQTGPQAVFPEMVYDAGTVEAGTDLTHTFKVKNVGKADLLIESVKPG